MIGLALEGGGIKGSYQAGVYMAFYECNIKIDGVCGTSVGAINGAIIASNKGEMLPHIWRSISVGDIFGIDLDLVKIINDKVINLDLIKLSIINILKIIKTKGLEIKGLKEILDKYVDVLELLNSNIDYGLCTVRYNDLKPIYLYKEQMKEDKVKDYILASAFLPIFKREKLIDNNYYLDGGFYDLGPVSMLLNKGYQKVYLVKVQGIGHRRKYDLDKVIVIEPKRSLGKLLDLNPKTIDENIKMGYYDTIRILKNYDGFNYVFKRKKESYYKFINKKVSKKLFKRVSLFFKSNTYKETTIKALEYVMEHEKINYYKIYKSVNIIRLIKKTYLKKHFIYIYVRKLLTYY